MEPCGLKPSGQGDREAIASKQTGDAERALALLSGRRLRPFLTMRAEPPGGVCPDEYVRARLR
ncbi:hypothetical protein MPC4_90070 [Methylocella tundrae]|uniref:Uncharacterized protein n=1 Tax=Methylocella tundrae TaxID=227605 RepID=A0A8B6MCX7_METTU|nr:hypothetical protein MPC1_1570004 [Methylocella tundrae]VTZ52595.1 hypothetical protein MPC4_90070 [Methylocella tundrae]